MKTKAVIMNLRIGNSNDFSYDSGAKRYGAIYFQQNFDGAFCTQPFYLTEATDFEAFKELYHSKQIWVPLRVFDEVEFIEVEHNN
jgi:hypothetical protein